MASWAEVAKEVPELAERVRHVFDAHKHKTMATVRSDGAPRISGTEATFVGDDLWIGSMPGARKGADLKRDPRFAHARARRSTPEMVEGDAKISGRFESRRASSSPSSCSTSTVTTIRCRKTSTCSRADIDEVVFLTVPAGADYLAHRDLERRPQRPAEDRAPLARDPRRADILRDHAAADSRRRPRRGQGLARGELGSRPDGRGVVGHARPLGLRRAARSPRTPGARATRVTWSMAVNEAIAEHGAIGPPAGLGYLLAAPTIVAHGNERQKQKDLLRILNGQDAWCQLFSEPGAGSDLASLGDESRSRTATSGSSPGRRCGRRPRSSATSAC